MAFYRKKIKWYHRLWNVFAYFIGAILVGLLTITLIAPFVYIIKGDPAVSRLVLGSAECLAFLDEREKYNRYY